MTLEKKLKSAIYAGSFDPITKGHMEIIKRSLNLFDRVIIGILNNPNKKTWFSLEERMEIVKVAVSNLASVDVKAFDGLLVDFAKANDCRVLVRGLRAVSDYEYELQLSLGNTVLSEGELETIFLPASRDNLYLSSSLVREIAINGGNLTPFMTPEVIPFVTKKVQKKPQ